jgi:hypothetical protein
MNLTNVEVLELIKQNQEKRTASNKSRRGDASGSKGEFKCRDFVERELMGHFLSSASILAGTSSASIKTYLSALLATNIHFERTEIVQMANMVPKSEVEIHLIFGDSRFTEEQIQQLIELSSLV